MGRPGVCSPGRPLVLSGRCSGTTRRGRTVDRNMALRARPLLVAALSSILAACGGGGTSGESPDAGPSPGQAEAAPGTPDAVAPIVCGDGALGTGEVCDDGNDDGGDGCAADCAAVESGWTCGDPGVPCVETQICGNGLLEP